MNSYSFSIKKEKCAFILGFIILLPMLLDVYKRQHAGGRDVYLIFEPMAAAIGIGIDVEAPEGNMIVDIGGGSVSYTHLPASSLTWSIWMKSVPVSVRCCVTGDIFTSVPII